MANTGPFYFALVEPTDTTFNPTTHNRWDFEIFSFTRTLEEGKMPKLELVIQNPLRGLLNGLVWAWFSYYDGYTWHPLFFGRLVGQPKQLYGTKITVELIGWPLDYVKQKQQVAESLKIDPFWDPVCVSAKDRDNPDTVLEANTKLYHVDHLTLQVTASDIINAEDGNTNFTADMAFYNYLDQTVGDPPLVAIQCTMSASWRQRWRGYVRIPDVNVISYSGDGILNDWPKPLANLGGGYTVAYSDASDASMINRVQVITTSYTYNNLEKTHANGDTLSLSLNITQPVFYGTSLSYITFWQQQDGYLDPFAVDDNGDPAPVNIPASYHADLMYVPQWNVTGSMTLLCQADRQRTEQVVMTLNGNFQPVLVDPTVQQDTETMTIQLADVGVPIINLRDFTAIAGTFVPIDTVIFPDYLSVPGATTAQIVTTAGTAAPFGDEPNFSNIPGVITTDSNGVQYTSLGNTNPTDGNQDWQANLQVAAGTIILPRQPIYTTWINLQHVGAITFPPVGVNVQVGITIRGSNGTFWRCKLSGVTNLVEPAWSGGWGTEITDGSVVWIGLGNTLPTGNDFFMAKNSGTTGQLYLTPIFNNSVLDAQTVDNTVTWVYIGSGEIPVGGTPENVTASNYIPTDRGQRSLRYGIAKMRARMLNRLRCVTTKFRVSFIDGIPLTLRMSSTLNDSRVPGGVCVGKNTLIELTGSDGAFRTNVTMKSCVGYSTTVEAVAGTPDYAQTGVFDDPNVQQMDGSVIVLPTVTDVGYTPPVATTVDDGVTFPILDPSTIMLVNEIRTDGDQQAAIETAFLAARAAAIFLWQPQHEATTVQQLASFYQQMAIIGAQTVGLELSKAAVWWDLQLKPLDAGPYGAYYNVALSTLQGPKQIDLTSGS